MSMLWRVLAAFLLVVPVGCTSGGGTFDDDDDTGDDDDDGGEEPPPPLICTPDGYASEPVEPVVPLVAATISVDQSYDMPDEGEEATPDRLLGLPPHIDVRVSATDPQIFPGAPEEQIRGINLYVNGCLLSDPTAGKNTWAWSVTGGDVPVRIVPGHWWSWELRSWRNIPTGDAGTGGMDAGGGEPMFEKKVLLRGHGQLPPGDSGGAGFPNFLTPARGEILTDIDEQTVTWEDLGLAAFTGQDGIGMSLQPWFLGTPIGGTRNLEPDGDPVSADEGAGTYTFHVGLFAEWKWIGMQVTIPTVPYAMRVTTGRQVNGID